MDVGSPPPPERSAPLSDQRMANPLHAERTTAVSRRDARRATRSAKDALESVPARDRFAALSEVQTAIAEGVVREQTGHVCD